VLAATLKVKRGEAAYERDSVVFNEIQYSWPVTAALMWAAAQSGGRLSVLDFGGSLGSSYFQHRQFFDGLTDIRWSVVEQPHFVQAGRQYIQNENLRFYETICECEEFEKPNVILLSSVLQYLEKPDEFLGSILKTAANVLIIDKTPYSSKMFDGLATQHVSADIYPASYPMHIFAESIFLEKMLLNWTLIASSLSPEGYVDSPLDKFAFKSFLFKRNKS